VTGGFDSADLELVTAADHPTAEGPHEATIDGELIDPIVALVADIDFAAGANRHRARSR
jgi:hypothetical protein